MKTLAGFVILGAIGVFCFSWWDKGGSSSQPQVETSLSQGKVVQEGTRKSREVRLLTGSPFLTEYGAEGGSVEEDLAILKSLLSECSLIIKNYDQFFLPDNAHVVKFLQGENPDRLAWLPKDHPSISEEGELIDRFSSPIYFHRLGGFRYEFRSAGEDGKHWTADDVTLK